MAIPNGVIFIWTGTNASIPAGWQRVTDLDDKFPKGNTDGSTNPNVTGGTSTHTHTSPAHSHTMNNHTHSVTVGDITTYYNRGGFDVVGSHTHGTFTSSNPVGGSLSSVTATYASVSNNPPYYDVIYITPASTVGGIPNLSLGLSDDSSFTNNTGKYNGYYKCDGNNSTPDLTDKYLKGASAGANAGTTGGSLTNVHTLTHTHSSSVHNHDSFNTGNSTPAKTTDTWGGSSLPAWTGQTHNHDITIGNYTDSPTDTPSLTTSETVEPAFKKLLAIQNRSGTIYTPIGIIALWLGTIANIPTNFEIVSAMYGRHLKITNTNGDIGSTGGSNTHTHTGNTHTHRSVSHNHTTTQSGHPDNTIQGGGNSIQSGGSLLTTFALTQSPHTITVSSVDLVYSTATTSADSSSNEPEFRTVAFIKYKGEKGGSFIFNLLK